MVSRETKLQTGLVTAVIVVWMLLFGVVTPGPLVSVALVAATYFLVMAGTHLYLAFSDESELIPVAARWRYVGLAALVSVAIFLQGTVGNERFGGVTVNQLLAGAFAVTIVGYFLYEARDGYLASRR